MAKLPIYTNSANISVAERAPAPSNPWKDTQETLQAGMELAVQWQKIQNSAETLDGKNRMNAAVKDILTEAEEYRDANATSKEIEAKEQELQSRMDAILPEITSGFSSDMNGFKFTSDNALTMDYNSQKLKEIFRNKTIDKDAAGRVVSYNENMKAFVQTGDKAYKESYLNDLRNSFEAGFISEKELAEQSLKVDDWDYDYASNLALTNPSAAAEYAKGMKKEGVKTVNLNNFIKAQQKRIDEEATQELIDSFQANPTEEGLKAIEIRVPDMKEKTLEALRETYRNSPNYEAVSTFGGISEAKNVLEEISNMNNSNANNAFVKLEAMGKYVEKLNRSNLKGTLSDEDRVDMANAAYRALNDDLFKAQVHSIFGKPSAFTSFVNWGVGGSDFNRIETIGLETTRNVIQALMDDEPEKAAQIYAEGQKEAIKIRYPDIPFDKISKGDVIWYDTTGQALKFMGFGLDDVLVEVDPQTGVVK